MLSTTINNGLKISILSDTHLEFDKTVVLKNQERSDVLVLAGDIGSGLCSTTFEFIKDCCSKYDDVVYILGNHEFYEFDIIDVVDAWGDISRNIPNLHFLYNKTVDIKGVRFIGSTLYSDTVNNLTIPESIYISKMNSTGRKELNDFNYIYYNGEKLNLNIYNDQYLKCLKFITDEINKDFDGKKVLVTHYATMMKSISDEFLNSPIRPFFTTDLSNLIVYSDLDLVIHGHHHNKSDYDFFGKRVVCNPYGYGQKGENDILQVIV